MVGREVFIGRNPSCDIKLGSECIYASGVHAKLLADGNQLYYQDMSRNGSMINNILVHQRTVPVRYGDSILIAGKYSLGWNVISQYFQMGAQQTPNNIGQGTAVSFDSPVANYEQSPINNNIHSAPAEQPDFGWNWGAFSLYPLWGFWNGCWWAILVSIFFGWIGGIIINILFGAMGSKWAWNNKEWKSAADFNEMQRAWKPWGIAMFVIGILFTIFVFIFYYALIISYLAYL